MTVSTLKNAYEKVKNAVTFLWYAAAITLVLTSCDQDPKITTAADIAAKNKEFKGTNMVPFELPEESDTYDFLNWLKDGSFAAIDTVKANNTKEIK